jgi:hypothetical protein
MLRTLTAGAFLMLGAMADEPTKGRTDGEPGNGEHCCGMKGLGGATVTVLCHPDTIALGQEFTVNVAYTTDIKRPVDVHVDLLNAQNKAVRPPPQPFPSLSSMAPQKKSCLCRTCASILSHASIAFPLPACVSA